MAENVNKKVFSIGQEVVCLETVVAFNIFKGQHYFVEEDIFCCRQRIFVGTFFKDAILSRCNSCKIRIPHDKIFIDNQLFAPLQTNNEMVEEMLEKIGISIEKQKPILEPV